jgi:probable HAF family extracellular repeat protein
VLAQREKPEAGAAKKAEKPDALTEAAGKLKTTLGKVERKVWVPYDSIGLVVGDSDTASGTPHAFVFDHSNLKDLGTLPGLDNASYARGINNSGDIVGESDSADQKRAFLYTKGQLVELDRLAENLSEAGFNSLDVAYGINDKGWIVGYGTTSDSLTAAFVAVPEDTGSQERAKLIVGVEKLHVHAGARFAHAVEEHALLYRRQAIDVLWCAVLHDLYLFGFWLDYDSMNSRSLASSSWLTAAMGKSDGE